MEKTICAWSMRHAGVLVLGLMTTSCFYVHDPIRYGRPQTGIQQAPTEPRTLDELQAERERVQAENTDVIPPSLEDPAPPPPPRRQEVTASIPVAKKVPGRDGFVFSPFNNKLIDVKGFPSGAQVRDPHYPASENKLFKVP